MQVRHAVFLSSMRGVSFPSGIFIHISWLYVTICTVYVSVMSSNTSRDQHQHHQHPQAVMLSILVLLMWINNNALVIVSFFWHWFNLYVKQWTCVHEIEWRSDDWFFSFLVFLVCHCLTHPLWDSWHVLERPTPCCDAHNCILIFDHTLQRSHNCVII